MSLVIISVFLFWLVAKKPAWLWLILPIGLFWDFWRLEPLGLTGLKILLLGAIFWLIFGQSLNRPKLKFLR